MAQWRKVIVSGSIAELNHVSASGNIIPVTDNASDLGSSLLEFKDLYLDGTANIDSLVADTADINGGTIDNASIGANTHTTIKGTTIDATTDFTIGGTVITDNQIADDGNFIMDLAGDLSIDVDGGDVTITDGGADLATINATKVSGSLASTGSFGALTIVDGVTDTLSPIINGTVDLGGSSNKWKDLYVVGTGSFGALTNDGEVYDTHLTGSFTGSFNGQVNLVDVSGTPSDNQISTFTDANTVQGESNLTFDGTNLLIASTGKLYLNDAGGEHISGNGSILSIAAGSEIDLTATDIDINGAVDVSGNLTVGGNLDVNGTVTTIDTVNVMVSESFSTHASGSSTAGDGGIGVQFNANGDTRGFGWDASATRWSFQNDLSYSASLISPDAFVSTVETGTGDGDSQGNPTYGGATGYGNIYIDTDDGEIWIFA